MQLDKQLDKQVYLGIEDDSHSGEFWVESLGKTLECSNPKYCDTPITVEGIEYHYGGYIWTSSRGDRGKKCYIFEPQSQREMEIRNSDQSVAREEQQIINENYDLIMSEWEAHPHYKYDGCTVRLGDVIPEESDWFETCYEYMIISPFGEVIESGTKSNRTVIYTSFAEFAKNWVAKYKQAKYSQEYDRKRKAEREAEAKKSQSQQEMIKSEQDQLWADWLDVAEWHELSSDGLSGVNPDGKKYTLLVYKDTCKGKACIAFKLYMEKSKTTSQQCFDRQSMLDAYTEYARIIKEFCTPKKVEKPIKRVIPNSVRK